MRSQTSIGKLRCNHTPARSSFLAFKGRNVLQNTRVEVRRNVGGREVGEALPIILCAPSAPSPRTGVAAVKDDGLYSARCLDEYRCSSDGNTGGNTHDVIALCLSQLI